MTHIDGHRPRSGVAMLVTLIVLLIVLIGIGAITRWISRGQHLDRIHRHQVQANWLAESGVSRALNVLNIDPEFSGDTWELSEPMQRPGRITTLITRDGGNYTVESIALYPANATVPRRAVRRITHPVARR